MLRHLLVILLMLLVLLMLLLVVLISSLPTRASSEGLQRNRIVERRHGIELIHLPATH